MVHIVVDKYSLIQPHLGPGVLKSRVALFQGQSTYFGTFQEVVGVLGVLVRVSSSGGESQTLMIRTLP